ncbi:Ammonium transporter [Desulfosporosinus metallidurans]|uniref:Ammonium transporter n=1 Tax=Desulfosporosinus metallidurans TaxID=1888891 RepID=A0A1Q8QPJ3_9FIRM|nr:Ammonium transporter [Desulfosporosinus metallidurans]
MWLEKLGLDDAVGAVSIHGFGDATGTILLAFLAPPEFRPGL